MAHLSTTTFILLIGLLVGALLAITCSSTPPSDENMLWQKTFPHLKLPPTLMSKLSPLTTSDIDHYASQIMDSVLLASNSLSFCKAAGIVCGEGIQVAKVHTGGHQGYVRSEVDLELFNELNANTGEPADFFRERDLVEGQPLHLPYLQVSQFPARKFLPHELAQSFSLTHDTLPRLFKTMHVPDRSNLSWQAHTTMFRCLAPAMKGESKRCVSSLKEMVGFLASTIGSEMAVLPPQDSAGSKQIGKLLEVSLLAPSTSTSMTCHDNMYPFQVYYCHSIEDTKVYQLKLQLEDGSIINKVATCHMDTSQWPDLHPAFAVLHVRPGESEACHYIVQDDLLFIPTH